MAETTNIMPCGNLCLLKALPGTQALVPSFVAFVTFSSFFVASW